MKPISKVARKAIELAVDHLFDRLKTRLLGKQMTFSLPGLFEMAAKTEGVETPNESLLSGLMAISESYLDAQKAKAKAQTIHKVQTFVQDASKKPENAVEVLKDELGAIWDKVHEDVTKIAETESTTVRNFGADDAIQRISALRGEDDPKVFFVVVRDGSACSECVRLHLMPDGVTPRVWRRSEVGSGYHKKGDNNPKIAGLHPHCLTGSQRIFTEKGLLTARELFELGTANTVVVDKRARARRVGNNQFGGEIPGSVWFYRHDSGALYRPATNVYETGIQECLKITLDSGHQMEMSLGHDMWIDRDSHGEKVRAENLSVGDKIPLLSGPGLFGIDNFPAHAELMGNLMGDGCLTKTTAIWHFFGDDIPYGVYLKKLASGISEDPKLKREFNIQPPNSKYNASCAKFSSIVLKKIFEQEFGLSKKPRRVPGRIWGANKETVAAFLRGLYAADGHSEGVPSVSLCQNDKIFLQEIQCLLANFGIVSRLHKHGDQRTLPIKYADGSVYQTNRKPAWRLLIGGWEQVSAFSSEIGMGVPRKQAQLEARLNITEERKRLGSWRTARIVSIEKIGKQQTYCLTEPVTNTITVNGIMTGNCRCSISVLMPGFGFDANGMVTWKGRKYIHSNDLKKNKSTPTFPKLGLPDDRRPTDIVTTPRQLKIKQLAIGNSLHREFPEADPKRFVGDAGAGMATPVGPANVSYATGGDIRPRTVGTDLGTQQHENLHMMLKRVSDKYGMKARSHLSTNLLNHAVKTVSPSNMAHFEEFVKARYPGIDRTSLPHEERLATLLNYLNVPEERHAYHSYKGHSVVKSTNVHKAFRDIYGAVRNAAKNADESWLKPRN